jgi:hypothetical protein
MEFQLNDFYFERNIAGYNSEGNLAVFTLYRQGNATPF